VVKVTISVGSGLGRLVGLYGGGGMGSYISREWSREVSREVV
jgi:hypothetical protein